MSVIDNISVNEQSSIRIEAEKIIYFDPFHIKGEPHDADVVFFTHSHYDHFSPEDIARVKKSGTVFAAPKTMAGELERAGISRSECVLLTPGESAEVSGAVAEAVPAYNIMKPFHPKKNGWLGYVVTVGGKRIYVCGDTDDTPEARNVRCDIICVPIGGTFTVDAKKAAKLVNKISPEYAVPIHFGTLVGKPSDADEFEKEVESSISVVRKIEI